MHLNSWYILGIGSSLLAEPNNYIHKTTIVEHSLLGSPGLRLLLLFLLYFRCLSLHFTGTCQTSVNLSHHKI